MDGRATALQFGCYIEGSTLRFDLLYPFLKISPIQARLTQQKSYSSQNHL